MESKIPLDLAVYRAAHHALENGLDENILVKFFNQAIWPSKLFYYFKARVETELERQREERISQTEDIDRSLSSAELKAELARDVCQWVAVCGGNRKDMARACSMIKKGAEQFDAWGFIVCSVAAPYRGQMFRFVERLRSINESSSGDKSIE